MNNAERLSRQRYAAKYDGQAGSLYKFALCVTGDKNQAEASMAKLFCEGYAYAQREDFAWHMSDLLKGILESGPSDFTSLQERLKEE